MKWRRKKKAKNVMGWGWCGSDVNYGRDVWKWEKFEGKVCGANLN
jgi:hypothetical protein